jgi:Zinc-finger of the MIZ type in Nse subunit
MEYLPAVEDEDDDMMVVRNKTQDAAALLVSGVTAIARLLSHWQQQHSLHSSGNSKLVSAPALLVYDQTAANLALAPPPFCGACGYVLLQCPLTGSLFVEPVASKVCSHVFSKAAIMQHIKICAKDKRDCKCPVPGCGRIIAGKDLEEHGPTVDALKLQALKVKEERRADSDDEVGCHINCLAYS